jgi:hypothetical protein
MSFHGGCYRCGGLAAADDDRTALRPWRQMRRQAQGRRRRVHRRLKHIQQQAAGIDAHDPFLFAMMTQCVAGGVQATPIS